jgi:hypothetical protein
MGPLTRHELTSEKIVMIKWKGAGKIVWILLSAIQAALVLSPLPGGVARRGASLHALAMNGQPFGLRG